MSLKDYIASDLDTVINLQEFAEIVRIDGKEQKVVIDEVRLQERAAEYGELATGMILYYIPVSAFTEKPKIGSHQRFNNGLYFVEDVSEHMGLYEILLRQNRGG